MASGNGAEEFWYTNVPTEYDDTFNDTEIYGYGPFREVQLLIDEALAGVSWPFPIVFTGGISPGLWVPIVGIDTYDLPSFEIDISPWLGLLCDGNAHTFELKVVGYESDTSLGTVGSNWWITAAIFIWEDKAGNQTTGSVSGFFHLLPRLNIHAKIWESVQSHTPFPTFDFTPSITTLDGANTSLWVHLIAERSLHYASTITTSSGSRNMTWSQSLSYSNVQNFTAEGYNETLSQLTTGISIFSPVPEYLAPITNTFSYPISFYQAYAVPKDAKSTNSTLIAELDRSLLSTTIPILLYLTSLSTYHTPEILATRQNGSCIYFWNNTYYEFAGAIDPAMRTIGATEQWFSSVGPVAGGIVEAYGRHVKAVDGYKPALTLDETFGNTITVPETESVGKDEL